MDAESVRAEAQRQYDDLVASGRTAVVVVVGISEYAALRDAAGTEQALIFVRDADGHPVGLQLRRGARPGVLVSDDPLPS